MRLDDPRLRAAVIGGVVFAIFGVVAGSIAYNNRERAKAEERFERALAASARREVSSATRERQTLERVNDFLIYVLELQDYVDQLQDLLQATGTPVPAAPLPPVGLQESFPVLVPEGVVTKGNNAGGRPRPQPSG